MSTHHNINREIPGEIIRLTTGVAFAEALTHRHRHTITHLTAGHDDLLEPLAAKLDDILNERRTLMTGLKELLQHTAALETHTLARQRITESAARDKYARPVFHFHPEYPAWRREADQLIATTRRYFASGQPALAPHLTHAPFAKRLREGTAALDTHIRHDRRYYRSAREQHNHAYPDPASRNAANKCANA